MLQLRPSRFGPRTVLLPLVIAGIVGGSYLHGFPTQGKDVSLIATFTIVGVLLGIASGLTTRVWNDGRAAMLRASQASAVIWIVGMTGRAAFQIWANGSGATKITEFSIHHDITSSSAWVDALVLMALGQVVARVVVIAARATRARGRVHVAVA